MQAIFTLTWTCFKRYYHEYTSLSAAALTFYTLFALVPLVVLGLAVVGLISIVPNQEAQVQAFLIKHFLPASSQSVELYLNTFVSTSERLSRVSSIFFLVTAVFLLINIEACFNKIWLAKAQVVCMTNRLLRYAVVLLVSPVLLGMSVGLSAILLSLRWLQHPLLQSGASALIACLPFLFTWMAITVLYYWLPKARVYFKHVLLAGFIAAILFELAKYGFQFYITQFPTYQIVYGAAALLPIFLFWVYLSWVIVLFGAILASELPHKA